MHNHDGKGNNSMMWMMVICCAVPLLLILFVGGTGRALGGSTWVIFGGVALMVIAHFFMMGRSHKHSDEEKSVTEGEGENKDSKDKKDHSGHGCCH
jgi:hypothetical protein